MSRDKFIELELEYMTNKRKYLENIWAYLSKIKDLCIEYDRGCRVLVFGSFIRGNMRVDSDVDVLIITKLAKDPLFRGRLFKRIIMEIGFENPFEIHIVTEEEFLEIKKFIDTYREVT
jgi:predicted nucleotidyltransferase